MPVTPPPIEGSKQEDLRDESLHRIPVHTPEWTDQSRHDPGVTIASGAMLLGFAALWLCLRRGCMESARSWLGKRGAVPGSPRKVVINHEEQY